MKIILSGNLKRFAEYESELEFDATSIPAALNLLVERYPEIRSILLDPDNKPRSLHRLHLNGEILSAEEVESRELGPNDEVGILTALAGG
jgi:hypothetical protein